MIEYKQSVEARAPVRLLDVSGDGVGSVLFGAVTATVEKGNGAVVAVTMSGANWSELITGAFSGAGAYNIILPASLTDVVGPLLYAIEVAGARKYVGAIQIVAELTGETPPYVTFIANGDTDAPVIWSAFSPQGTQVQITYSEPVVMTAAANGALNIANYTIPGLTITAIVSLSTASVMLTTSLQTPGAPYNLTVINVEDLSGNPIG